MTVVLIWHQPSEACSESSQKSDMEFSTKTVHDLKPMRSLQKHPPQTTDWLGFWKHLWLYSYSLNSDQILEIKKDIKFLVEVCTSLKLKIAIRNCL